MNKFNLKRNLNRKLWLTNNDCKLCLDAIITIIKDAKTRKNII